MKLRIICSLRSRRLGEVALCRRFAAALPLRRPRQDGKVVGAEESRRRIGGTFFSFDLLQAPETSFGSRFYRENEYGSLDVYFTTRAGNFFAFVILFFPIRICVDMGSGQGQPIALHRIVSKSNRSRDVDAVSSRRCYSGNCR